MRQIINHEREQGRFQRRTGGLKDMGPKSFGSFRSLIHPPTELMSETTSKREKNIDGNS